MSFDASWSSRHEAAYIHWTRDEPMNQVQLAFRKHWELFKEIMDGRFEGGQVLEVGCGRGSMSAYFSDNGFRCTLMDYSTYVIDMAREVFNTYGLKASFTVGDALTIPYRDGTFDVVFSIGLLEHFKSVEIPLAEQIRVIKKGGLFLGYIVPQYKENIQQNYEWVNALLKEMAGKEAKKNGRAKKSIFRSDCDSRRYLKVLCELGIRDLQVSGVYPLPMISHSIEFPFTLLSPACEKILVDHFQELLHQRREETGRNPWICEEGYGQAFLIWGYKS